MKAYSAIVLIALATLTACSSAPIHAVFISNEKSVWIEDPGNAGLSYCVANVEAGKADPVCFAARRGVSNEKVTMSEPRSHEVEKVSTPAAHTASESEKGSDHHSGTTQK